MQLLDTEVMQALLNSITSSDMQIVHINSFVLNIENGRTCLTN